MSKIKKSDNFNIKYFELKKEIGAISKDITNPFYNSQYFDINILLNHLEPLFIKHRLILKQPLKFDAETGINYVQTYLECVDTSIRSDDSTMKLPEIQDPQKLGSAITYYRRYTLVSLLGIRAQDDDANSASKHNIKSPLTDSNKWNDAIDYIKNGGKVEAILQKYILSKDQKTALEEYEK
tara:strand:+ start:28 stop:570 length:543 start_codon:yes stop_codon:yes gene_type:complete